MSEAVITIYLKLVLQKVPYETVPYKGKVEEKLLKFLKSSFKMLLPNKCDGYQT